MQSHAFTVFGKAMAGLGFQVIASLSHISKTLPSPCKQVANRMVTFLAFGAIHFYKRYIDPYKKGKCAHRVLYSGLSCSDYISEVAAEYGVATAIPLVAQRYAKCQEAHLLLQQNLLSGVDHNDCVHCGPSAVTKKA